jgi:hypothetical protein
MLRHSHTTHALIMTLLETLTKTEAIWFACYRFTSYFLTLWKTAVYCTRSMHSRMCALTLVGDSSAGVLF